MTFNTDLIPVVPGLVEHFKPRLKYLLIDENAYSDTELASLNNLVAAVFRFEQADSPATIEGLISLLIDWLADRPDLSAHVFPMDTRYIDEKTKLRYLITPSG